MISPDFTKGLTLMKKVTLIFSVYTFILGILVGIIAAFIFSNGSLCHDVFVGLPS